MSDFVEHTIAHIRKLIGDKAQVIGAVSGGVDSTVVARLICFHFRFCFWFCTGLDLILDMSSRLSPSLPLPVATVFLFLFCNNAYVFFFCNSANVFSLLATVQVLRCQLSCGPGRLLPMEINKKDRKTDNSHSYFV